MTLNFTKAQKSAFVGMILGDGYLQTTGRKNARLRLEHSLKQKEYLEWKMELLPKIFQGKVIQIARKHPISKKTYLYVRMQSNASPFIGKFRKVFYPEGKKSYPENLFDYLKHPLGLAIWYMDDGYYYERDKASYIYLGRVSREEAHIAQGTLEKMFQLSTRILDKKNKGYVLYFSPQESRKLSTKIKKFVPSFMKYKLPS